MNRYDYTCTKCGRIKKYKHKHAYENAVRMNKPCTVCNHEKYLLKLEDNFQDWVRFRQKTNCPNKQACNFMDYLNERGFHFKHGLNGGEEFLDISYTDYRNNCHRGIFLDGWDEINKIIFEWDEPEHNLLDKALFDFDRQSQIFQYYDNKNIRVRFVRFDEENGELYEVKNQNPYNLLMNRALSSFTNELKKWNEKSNKPDKDNVVFNDMMEVVEAFSEYIDCNRIPFDFNAWSFNT